MTNDPGESGSVEGGEGSFDGSTGRREGEKKSNGPTTKICRRNEVKAKKEAAGDEEESDKKEGKKM